MTSTPTSTERVRAYRERKKAEGAAELRGVFAHVDDREAIKALALKLAKKRGKASRGAT